MRNYVENNWHSFTYPKMPNGMQQQIPLVLNPVLHGLFNRSQELINEKSVAIIRWMDDFARRKVFVKIGNSSPLYGSNNTIWTNVAHPRNLPRYLEGLPNFNDFSVVYTASFVFPECRMSDANPTQISSNQLDVENKRYTR